MNGQQIDDLGQRAADAAMRAAADYLAIHHLTADMDALCACLRSWSKIALPKALRDAREAIDAGMGEVGVQTFLASMALAGIEAAKEAGRPRTIS